MRPEGAKSWRWEVTPRWKRSPNSAYVSYRENANSAQVKVYAVQLVLAARRPRGWAGHRCAAEAD
ncbi:hypothetical protein [Streptomyces sp. NPDC057909]|uniref:hypothetical protein n=1 Tax=Streptomyces sp. NPDC057909 TaxID=3346277 RepID=UPI0036E4D974